MAKETMQAVSDAEAAAHQVLQKAGRDSEELLAEAARQADKLVADAEKEAAKRGNVLVGVAKADAQKIQAAAAEETRALQEELRAAAEKAYPQASAEIRRILLDRTEGR